MLLHEHLNYFDGESLAHVLRAAGFEPLLLEPARHGGVLLCCAVPATNRVVPDASVKGDSKFQTFRAKAQTVLRRFAALADQSGRGELGLYVPLRAFPYLGQLSSDVRLRFFDDDPGLRGRYFDGFDVAIENRDELAARPPGHVMICSLAFGHKIAARLRERQLGELRIVMWSDLFDEMAG
jgi:hypothetical protein